MGVRISSSSAIALLFVMLSVVSPLLTGGYATSSHGSVPPLVVSPNAGGPGAGKILIHEYRTVAAEMQAFRAGNLDFEDWPVPAQYLNTWTQTAPGSTNCDTSVPSIICPGDGCRLEADFFRDHPDRHQQQRITNRIVPAFRQALGYLVDRQNIVLNFASGEAIPICAATAPGQPSAESCLQLGDPSQYGDYNPTKALQLLYENGWRYDPAAGFLGSPSLPAPVGGVACPAPCTRPLISVIRFDDPIRVLLGQALMAQLQNLPASYTPTTGGAPIVVCPSPASVCKINVVNYNCSNPFACTNVVFTAPWNDWDLYTGSWTLDLFPDQLIFLYVSAEAAKACGGQWLFNFARNYDCFVDPTYDSLAAQINNPCIPICRGDPIKLTQEYAWGYDSATGRIRGKMPTIPLYTPLGVKAAWIRDQGANPLRTDGTIGTSSDTFSQRACWQSFLGSGLEEELGSRITLTNLFLDNCQGNSTSYASYKGSPNAILDYRYSNTIIGLNPATAPNWPWDDQTMQFVYDSMLKFSSVAS